MKMKRMILAIGIGLLAVGAGGTGCKLVEYQQQGRAAIAADPVLQAQADAELGRWRAIAEALPHGAVAWPFLSPLLLGLVRFRLGKRLHKAKAPSVTPIWGNIGQVTQLENLTHGLEQFRAGMLELGADGSATKRGYKVGIITALSIGAMATAFPDFMTMIQGHLQPFLAMPFVAGLLAGVEKKLSTVKPLAEVPPTV